MQLTERSHNPSGLFGWFTYERRNWMAITLVAFCLGYSFGNGHTTQGAISHISDQLGQKQAVVNTLQKKVVCEHKTATKAVDVARKAIVGAQSDTVPIPSPAEIPKDNCGAH